MKDIIRGYVCPDCGEHFRQGDKLVSKNGEVRHENCHKNQERAIKCAICKKPFEHGDVALSEDGESFTHRDCKVDTKRDVEFYKNNLLEYAKDFGFSKIELDEGWIKEAVRNAFENNFSENNDPKKKCGDLKDPMHLLPTGFMRSTAKVLKIGADKYGVYNWRYSNGVRAMTYIAAIMRHLTQFMDGEDSDKESGQSHLAHISATCAILIDAKRAGKLIDDRAKIDEDDLT